MSDSSDILIVGGRSRLGAALAARLGRSVISVSRRSAREPNERKVERYDDIPTAMFDGIKCIVNCVGASEGGAPLLAHVNVEIPRRLALAAKSAGVPRLIHISSFSVYGAAHSIDLGTLPSPATSYGRSKLAGDNALLALADERFAITILRLPLIYDRAGDGKLGRLLRFWEKAGWFPVPVNDVARAMIGVDLAADVIARLIRSPDAGIAFAADPVPFTYADVARTREGRLRLLFIPGFIARVAQWVVPSLGGRLWADSRLAEKDNLAVRYGLASTLYYDIAAADVR